MPIRKIARLPGVEGVRVGKYPIGLTTCVWFFRVDDTLIDCGPRNQAQFVLGYARQHNVKRALVSHHHEDHAGTAYVLQNAGIEVLASKESARLMKETFHMSKYRRVFFGVPESVDVPELPSQIETSTGVAIQHIEAPGHAPDHSCFYCPDRGWLFGADLYVTRHPAVVRYDENIQQEMETLRRILDLDFDTLFCGHQGIVHNGKEKVQEKLQFFEDMQGKLQYLLARDPTLRNEDLTRKLLGSDFGGIQFVTAGHFSKLNLIKKLRDSAESGGTAVERPVR